MKNTSELTFTTTKIVKEFILTSNSFNSLSFLPTYVGSFALRPGAPAFCTKIFFIFVQFDD
jgi:hypothetical protein